MAKPEGVAVTRKCHEGMIEISAGPVGSGPFKGQQVKAFCIDQGHLANSKANSISITPKPDATTYEVVQFDAQGKPTVLSSNATKAQAETFYAQWKVKYNVSVGGGFKNTPNASVSMPHSSEGFDGLNQPLVNVPGRQREIDGRQVLGAKEICELRGLRLPTPAEAGRAAGGPQQFPHSSSDGTLNRLAIHSCAGDQSHKRGESCPQTTRDVGAQAGKGVYVSWPQSDGTKAEYFDGNGNVWIWAYENGTYYVCGGSWNDYNPEDLEAGYCFEYNPEDFGYNTGVRCASPQDSEQK